MNLLLTLLATLRLTRFITSDYLGHWWIVQPARRWAVFGTSLYHTLPESIDAEWAENEPTTPRQKLVKGLDCGYCVSPWLFGGILIAQALVRFLPAPFGIVLRWLLTTLAGSYVVGTVWNRLDN